MKVHVLEEAATELIEAIEYYEDLEAGLVVRLKLEVPEHLAIIAAAPDRLRQRPRGYRRINLRIFPYYVAYFLDGEILWIVAIAHAHRRPEYWRKRRPTASDSDTGGIF